MKEVEFKSNTICDRCGMSKTEVKRSGSLCSSWGQGFESHIWNKEAVLLNVEYFKAK